MRVLLDAWIDSRVVALFANHEAQTTFDFGWSTLKDRDLLRLVDGRFDVLITGDKGFEIDSNLNRIGFGIVVVYVPLNKIELYMPLQSALIEAVERVKPGEVVHVL